MFSIFINFCKEERIVKKEVDTTISSNSDSASASEREINSLCNYLINKFCNFPLLSFTSKPFTRTNFVQKDSSNSSIDDDAYLDEQEDPMTDQQSQNNQPTSVPGAGNTLPIKSTGIAARSVNVPWAHLA